MHPEGDTAQVWDSALASPKTFSPGCWSFSEAATQEGMGPWVSNFLNTYPHFFVWVWGSTRVEAR